MRVRRRLGGTDRVGVRRSSEARARPPVVPEARSHPTQMRAICRLVHAWYEMCEHDSVALKYGAELPRCQQPCDCLSRHIPRHLTVFRLLHCQATEADFVPPAKESEQTHRGVPRCGNLALSFFTTLNKARRQVADLLDRGVDVGSRCGDRIGTVEIFASDGLLSARPSSSGHLNLFQEEGVTFASRVSEYHAQTAGVQGANANAS